MMHKLNVVWTKFNRVKARGLYGEGRGLAGSLLFSILIYWSVVFKSYLVQALHFKMFPEATAEPKCATEGNETGKCGVSAEMLSLSKNLMKRKF